MRNVWLRAGQGPKQPTWECRAGRRLGMINWAESSSGLASHNPQRSYELDPNASVARHRDDITGHIIYHFAASMRVTDYTNPHITASLRRTTTCSTTSQRHGIRAGLYRCYSNHEKNPTLDFGKPGRSSCVLVCPLRRASSCTRCIRIALSAFH